MDDFTVMMTLAGFGFGLVILFLTLVVTEPPKLVGIPIAVVVALPSILIILRAWFDGIVWAVSQW